MSDYTTPVVLELQKAVVETETGLSWLWNKAKAMFGDDSGPPAVVPIPAGYKRARPHEVTKPVLAFANLALRHPMPIGKRVGTVINDHLGERMIIAQTEWHHDNHDNNPKGVGPATWHPGISILVPIDNSSTVPADLAVVGEEWCCEFGSALVTAPSGKLTLAPAAPGRPGVPAAPGRPGVPAAPGRPGILSRLLGRPSAPNRGYIAPPTATGYNYRGYIAPPTATGYNYGYSAPPTATGYIAPPTATGYNYGYSAPPPPPRYYRRHHRQIPLAPAQYDPAAYQDSSSYIDPSLGLQPDDSDPDQTVSAESQAAPISQATATNLVSTAQTAYGVDLSAQITGDFGATAPAPPKGGNRPAPPGPASRVVASPSASRVRRPAPPRLAVSNYGRPVMPEWQRAVERQLAYNQYGQPLSEYEFLRRRHWYRRYGNTAMPTTYAPSSQDLRDDAEEPIQQTDDDQDVVPTEAGSGLAQDVQNAFYRNYDPADIEGEFGSVAPPAPPRANRSQRRQHRHHRHHRQNQQSGGSAADSPAPPQATAYEAYDDDDDE